MPPRLELRFESDSDGTGRLLAFVHRHPFSGGGSAWFHIREILEFGNHLSNTFPLPQGTEVVIKGGEWMSGSNPPRLETVLLALRVYPIGTTGTIGLHVQVGEGDLEAEREEARAKLCVELLTDYESLRTFGNAIVHLLQAPGAVASLHPNAV